MPRLSAYHREIGREATAAMSRTPTAPRAYHREIGREATAQRAANLANSLAYHREIGREATAPLMSASQLVKPPARQSSGRTKLTPLDESNGAAIFEYWSAGEMSFLVDPKGREANWLWAWPWKAANFFKLRICRKDRPKPVPPHPYRLIGEVDPLLMRAISSTLRSDSGVRTHIITARRRISGNVLK